MVHVEGQTEERFVDNVLAPHLYSVGYTKVSAHLLGNSRQRSKRGGIRSWNSVLSDIVNHLKGDRAALVTTMVDYYGLLDSWPGREETRRRNAIKERAESVERGISEDVARSFGGGFDRRRFIPYVMMHEFEGLLFSDPDRFARGIGRPDLTSQFQAIRSQFQTPEEINDSPDTAPSKRVINLYKGYQKPLMGVHAVEEIGLDAIRRECLLFNRWIDALEEWARP